MPPHKWLRGGRVIESTKKTMETIKKILKLVAGMLTGAAVGYFGVMGVIWLVDGSLPSSHSSNEGVDWGMMALSIGVTLAALVVAVMVHLILHEAGHLIAGLLTGYRFLSFRVFRFTLVKTSEGLRWKKFHIAGTGGQCILELPEDQDVATMPWFWYNAGGVLMNLAIMLLSIVLLRLFDPGIVGFALLIMLAFVGLSIALMNGIPCTINGVSNDGHNIWMMWRRPAERRFFLHSLQIAGQLSRGKRIGEMPAEWTEDCPVTGKSSYLELSNRITYMALLEDQGAFDKARQVAEELMALGKKLPQLLQMEVANERVMLELMTTNREEVVGELWSKQVARYTELNSKYSPIKCAVLYAYELLHNHNAEKAGSYKRHLEMHRNDYTMPGEALTALWLIEKIDEKGS